MMEPGMRYDFYFGDVFHNTYFNYKDRADSSSSCDKCQDLRDVDGVIIHYSLVEPEPAVE
jgi:hypothetical protein